MNQHSEDFAFWEMMYDWGLATKAQIRFVTSKGKLTKDEYEEITGEEYKKN